MIIAIEGMDGAGKSFVAKKIADEFDYEYRALPNKSFFNMNDEEYKALCNRVYSLNDDYAKAWFFGFGNIISTKNVGKSVVLDRHFLSNYFWNGTVESEEVFKTMLDLIGIPDLTIVLYAGSEERMKRIASRDLLDKDLKDPDMLVFGYDKMIEFANKYKLPFLVINTEKFDKNMVVKICNQLIKKIQNYSKDEVSKYCNDVNLRIKNKNAEPFSKYLK